MGYWITGFASAVAAGPDVASFAVTFNLPGNPKKVRITKMMGRGRLVPAAGGTYGAVMFGANILYGVIDLFQNDATSVNPVRLLLGGNTNTLDDLRMVANPDVNNQVNVLVEFYRNSFGVAVVAGDSVDVQFLMYLEDF